MENHLASTGVEKDLLGQTQTEVIQATSKEVDQLTVMVLIALAAMELIQTGEEAKQV